MVIADVQSDLRPPDVVLAYRLLGETYPGAIDSAYLGFPFARDPGVFDRIWC